MSDRIADRYEVIRTLGSGLTGDVLLVRDEQDGALRALKRLTLLTPEAAARMRDEFAVLARIDHPNIVKVFDYGLLSPGGPGGAYFTMEFLDGEPLDKALRPGDVTGAVRATRDILAGLEALYAAGLVHCDLKPSNIMVTPAAVPAGPPVARILDFGFAERVGAGGEAAVRGTPGYVAPELLDGAPYSRASDAYALGVTLYRVLSGRPPFPGHDVASLLAAQKRGRPSALPLRTVGVPRALEAILLGLLDPEPETRSTAMQSLAQLVEARAPGGASLWESGRTAELGRGTFVARTEELSRLMTHALRGDVRIATVSGVEGAGRTRLAREVAIRAELGGWSVVWFDAEHPPGAAERIPDQGAGRLVVLDDVDSWPPGALERLDLREASLPLAIVATTAPGGSRGPWQRFFLLVPEDPVWLELSLSPFDAGDANDLVRARLGVEPPPGLVEALRSAVGGFPGALHAGVDRLMRAGALRRFGDKWEFDPRSVTDALSSGGDGVSSETEVRGLSARARRILLAIAGSPEPISAHRVAEIAGEPEEQLADEIRQLEWAGWIERSEDGRLVMADVRARRVLEEVDEVGDAGVRATRERLVRELKADLEREDSEERDPVVRSRTLRLLGTHEWRLGKVNVAISVLQEAVRTASAVDRRETAEATRILVAALPAVGLESARAFAELAGLWRKLENLSEAANWWHRALDALPREEIRLRMEYTEEAAGALYRLGRHEDAVRIIDAALQLQGETASAGGPTADRARSRLLGLRGAACHLLGRTTEARDALDESIRLLEADAFGDRALQGNRLAILQYLAFDPELGRRALDEALSLAERSGDAATIGRVHANLSLVARLEGRFDDADRHMSAALSNLEPLGDPDLLGNLLASRASILSHSARWTDLEVLSRQVEAMARRSGNEPLLLSILATRASVAARRGRISELASVQRTERAWLHRTDRPDAVLHHKMYLAERFRLLGQASAPRRLLNEVLRHSNRTAGSTYQALSRDALGRLALENGDGDRSERAFRSVLKLRALNPDLIDSAWLSLARIALLRDDRTLWEEAHSAIANTVPRALGAAAVRNEITAIGDFFTNRLETASQGLHHTIDEFVSLDLVPRAIETAFFGGRELVKRGSNAAGRSLLLRGHALARNAGLTRWAGRIADDLVETSGSLEPGSAGEQEDVRNVLLQVSDVLNSLLDFPTLLRGSLALVCERIGAERGFILLTDPATGEPRPVASFGVVDDAARDSAMEVSKTVVRRVTETGQAFRSDDAVQDPRLGSTLSVMDMAVRSLLCVPLRIRDELIGTVYAESRSSVAVFTEKELALVESFSNLVAISIQNSRLHDDLKRSRERVIQENLSLRREVTGRYQRTNIIGQSAEIERVLGEVERVALSRGNVLITGESGTGKELVAKTIHFASPRRDRPFLSLNCAALPADLIEAELFGIEDHVATGVRGRPGIFERADGGTLFLDEIGDMPLSLQAKLLRVLQEREFTRLGGSKVIRVDIRLIVATNQDLRQLIRDQRFREDLFFRIHTLPIQIPPLRDRKVDIPILGRHFLERFCEENGLPVPRMSSEFVNVLLRSSWPGNVRELQNYIERSIVMSRAPILEPIVLPSDLEGSDGHDVVVDRKSGSRGEEPVSEAPGDLKEALEDVERRWILQALEDWKGNQRQAARALGILEPTLRYRIAKLGIPVEKPPRTSKRSRPRRIEN